MLFSSQIGTSEKKAKSSTTIAITTRNDVCRMMIDTLGNDPSRLNALFGLGFTYANVVLLSGTYEGQRYAIKCLCAPLQLYLQSFLCVFGWEEKDGVLYSSEQSSLNGGDLVDLICNSREALKSQL